MTLLSPLGLLGLAALPILLWLWRMAASQRQVRVPSLIPYERLLRRAQRQRTRLVVNLLFWLQAIALVSAIVALTQPVVWLPRTKTILIVLDTSASMGSRHRGPASFAQAVAAVRSGVGRKAPSDQVFLMTTAPVAALLPQPTSDGNALLETLQRVRVAHLSGNLSTAVRIGRSLLGRDPEELWIVTDEPQPPGALGPSVRWIGVGAERPNAAIIGVQTQGTFCHPSDAQFVVTVENYAAQPMAARVSVAQGGRHLGEVRVEVPSRGQAPAAVALADATPGIVQVALDAPDDSLDADNHAWLMVPRTTALPVRVRVAQPAVARTLSAWLSACAAIDWSAESAPGASPALVITDGDVPDEAAALLIIRPPVKPEPVLSHWLVASDHPIGAYLPMAGVVSAALDVSADALGGVPVISSLIGGRRVPIVVADQRGGRRTVTFHLDVAGQEAAPALLVPFFNSLQWLMGQEGAAATGAAITVSGWAQGTVSVRRPDGVSQTMVCQDGRCSYADTTVAGVYEFTQGRQTRTIPVNFIDSLESNLMERASTWSALEPMSAASETPSRRPMLSLAPWLLWLVLSILALEWWVYSNKQSVVRRP